MVDTDGFLDGRLLGWDDGCDVGRPDMLGPSLGCDVGQSDTDGCNDG